jgi:glycosyltransferase involved in cell wall biosynthesis
MDVSVIIPAYNEQNTILEILHRVKQEFDFFSGEIIVVDDGSHDATRELAASVPDIKIISMPCRVGKGAAVRAGLAEAAGDIILIQDADMEYDPTDYPALLKPILAGEYEAVFGSCVLGIKLGRLSGRAGTYFYFRELLLSWLTRLFFNAKITAIASGYKVVRKSLLQELSFASNGFEFSPEITAEILKRGKHILEVPISYMPQPVEEKKKSSRASAWRLAWCLLKTKLRKR